LREVVDCAGEVLHQIEVEGTRKTPHSTVIIGNDVGSVLVDKCKVYANLLFRECRFGICHQQIPIQLPAMVQLIDIAVGVGIAARLIGTFVIGEDEHTLELDLHIAVLHPSTHIVGVCTRGAGVVGNDQLVVVFHVLVTALAGLAAFIVFALAEPDNIIRVLEGEKLGTTVSK